MKIFFLFFFLYTVQAGINNELSNHGVLPVFPFALAAIVYEEEEDFPKCISGFITRDTILTTAQCLFCDRNCDFEVFVYMRDGMASEKFDVLKWEINDQYDGTNLEDDIGYVKLKREVPQHDVLTIPPKKIYGHRLRGYTFVGKYTNKHLYPDFLRVKVISSELCSFTLGTYIPETKICVYSDRKNTDLPYHQAKPLVLFGEYGRLFYGLYNIENTHNKQGARIAVYQSISQYIDWINIHVFNDTHHSCPEPEPLFPPLPNPIYPTKSSPVSSTIAPSPILLDSSQQTQSLPNSYAHFN